jgi:cytochrome c-type biogenesis protein CcmE
MKRFYIRWGAVLAIGVVIGLLGLQRYYRDVNALSPEQLLREQPVQAVRVLGRIEGGSLVKEEAQRKFLLSGESEKVSVSYRGEETESLRELKTLVVEGKWDPSTRILEAQKISITPNYGFITAAYLVSLIPLGLFLFNMERKVALLYIMIKQEKAYQAEEQL